MSRLWVRARYRYGAEIRSLLLSCAAPLLVSCTLDVRTLRGDGGAAGTGSGAGSGGGGSTGAPPFNVNVPVCAYPNSEPDCDSLIDDAGFMGGIESWRPEPLAIAAQWSPDDANGNRDSGSIAVINTMHGIQLGIAPGGAMQCLTASPGEVFAMAADVFIPEGQGDGLPATQDLPGAPFVSQAGLGVLFWPVADCPLTAASQGYFQTELVSDAGVWHHVEGSVVAPPTAVSVSVRALTIKPFRQFAFEAHFDNILLQRAN